MEAREVIPEKLWIITEKGGKIGTLRASPSGYEFYDERTRVRTFVDSIDVFSMETMEIPTDGEEYLVDGYPTKSTPYPASHEKLPVYRKTKNGNAIYAAGYYIIQFKDWLPSFSPKLDTLEKYPYSGPYRTEWEMNIELKKHKR